MTNINGVDPIVVNNIKVLTQNPVVIETKKTKNSDNQKDKKHEEKKKRLLEPTMENLFSAIDKLNELLERNKIPLYFQTVKIQGVIKVQLVDADNKNIISEMVPEKVFDLLMKSDTTGFTIDELI